MSQGRQVRPGRFFLSTCGRCEPYPVGVTYNIIYSLPVRSRLIVCRSFFGNPLFVGAIGANVVGDEVVGEYQL